MNEIKDSLLNECLAFQKFGQEINPVHVKEMIEKAFKAGYEQAILNYCEPYYERK